MEAIKTPVKKQPKGVPKKKLTVIKKRVEEQPVGIPEKEEPRIPRWKRGIRDDRPAVDIPSGEVVSRATDQPPVREYTPRELYIRSRWEQIQTIRDYTSRRLGIYPTETYYIHESYYTPEGKGYRHVKGSNILADLSRGFSQYMGSQFAYQQQLRTIPFGYTIREMDGGYAVAPASSEFIREYKGKYVQTFGMTPSEQKAYRIISKLSGQPIETLAEAQVRYPMGGEEQKRFWFGRQDPFRKVSFTLAGAMNPFAWLAGQRYGAPSGAPSLVIGTATAPLTGADMDKEWGYAQRHLPYSIIATGGEFIGGWIAAPAVKWALKPITKPIMARLPTRAEYLSGFTRVPGYKYLTNIKSAMGRYKGYYADIRIARGITTPTQPYYGGLPAYLGRGPYGGPRVVSTLEQLKGTLIRSGWRSGDPLKSAEWQYYYYTAPEKVLVPRIASIRYVMDATGKISLKRVYDIKLKMPQLATGEYPMAFRISRIPIAITEFKGMKGFTYRTADVSRMVTPTISKTGLQTIQAPSVATTMTRPRVSYVDPRFLHYLETLQPPYESYVYPTGMQIGIRAVTPLGPITGPIQRTIAGVTAYGFGANIFDVMQKRITGKFVTKPWFVQQDVFDRLSYRALTSPVIATKFMMGVATGAVLKNISLLSTKAATQSISITRQVSLPKYMPSGAYVPYVPFEMPRTPYTHPKPSIPVFPYIPPMMLGAGRGRRGLGKAGMDFRYLFREFKNSSLSKLLKGVKLK